MKLHHVFLMSLIALLLAMGCNRDKVTVTRFEPQGKVKDLQSFTVTFSHDLAPEDKLDEWLDEEFISFKPEISGRFKWLNANTLLFSPDRPLEASQDFSAKVTKAVLFGKSLSLDSETHSFFTAHFEALGVNIYWEPMEAEGDKHEVKVAANVNFSHEVSPDELRKHLKVTRDGQKITDFQITTGSPAKELGVSIGKIERTKKNQKFEVTLKKGLVSVLGRSPLKGDREFSTNLPPIEELAITGATSGFDGKKAWVEILTTQMASESRISQYIEISPKPKGMKIKVDRNKIRITGDMTSGKEYDLKVKKGLPGLYGGKLDAEFTQKLQIADLEPKLKFADKALYLLKGGEQNLNIDAINVQDARVSVHEVFKNNLLFFFYENYNYNNIYHSDRYYNRYGQDFSVRYYGKQLFEEEIEFQDAKNLQQNHTVNLDRVIDQKFKGIYMVSVRSDQDYWLNDARLVAISDIGLIAKHNGDEIWVFANSLSTANPVAGAEVKMISTNNQTLQTATTGPDGVARFTNINKENEGFYPALLTAQLGEDFNFLDIRSARVETSRYDVGGKTIPPDGFNTYLYGDRNIYRPGETAYISGIVRGPDMEITNGQPMVLKIRNPRGKDFETFKKELNEQGSFEVSVNLPDFAQTGQYVAELYTGDDTYISSYRFNVEAFVPDKIRVNLEKDKEVVEMGKSIDIDITSEYLFGAPAANHKYEMDVRLRHNYFYSKAFSKFRFGGSSIKNSGLDNHFAEGELDENGKATQDYTLPGSIQSQGYLSGNATVSVFDVTGRTVNRSVSFKAFPKNYFIGIQSAGYYYSSIDDDQNYKFIAVDANDKPIANFPMEVELIRHEWKTVLKKVNNSGRFQYQSEKKVVKQWKKSVTLGSTPTPFTFNVDYSGEYELRVSKKGSSDYNSYRFYAYSYGRSSASSFEIDKEGRVEIILDKEKYKPGERAKALFVTPFTGKMLVTVERENVIQYQYIDIKKNSTELSIDIGSDQIPNAYISATLFRPHSADNSGPFLVGHGYVPIMVESEGDKLPVEIIAPEGRVKPRTKHNIIVKTVPERDVFVTFAAVDEGILQVKNFKTPNPYASMYAKRSLQVSSYDMYKYLYPEIATSSSSPAGGDEEGARGKRLNPVKAKRFKLLARWSGILRTNSSGEVRIPLELPQYNGEVRLMAVAYEGRRFGSADKALKVADDVILQPAVPRFLAIGDSLTIPVSVMNTTQKAGDVKVNMAVEGPMEIVSKKGQQVSVKSNGTSNTSFTLVAKQEVGKGKITFTTTGMDEVKEEIEIAVRPISGLVVDGGGGSIKAGETKTFTIPSDYIASTQHSGMAASLFPAVKFGRELKGLVGYPHGCLEQTTSKVFPQLYLSDIANLIAPEIYRDGNPQYYVKQGILKLQGMVLNDGSFSYWPGYNRYHWWGTAYATHFLVEAKNAGYQVDESVMERALDFLTRRAADRTTYQYNYWDNGSWRKKKIARKESIYSLYVLALAGRAEESFMNYYRGKPELLSKDTRYLLAGSFALNKNFTAFNELIGNSFAPLKVQRTSSNSFDSELRANALMLNVLLDTDPQNPQIPGMVKYLEGAISRSYSTQERAWAFLALGKLARRAAGSDVKIQAIVDGKTIHTFTGKHDSFQSDAFNGKTVTLKATGKGETFFYWNTEGVKTRGVTKDEDLNLKVRRSFYDRRGNAITNGRFKQGDLIVCGISLTGGTRTVPNVAITDLIPSGFEIENPRLNTSADLSWIDGRGAKIQADYMDVRDDRMILFTTAYANNTRTYYYMLRVINTGAFQLPAIGAESMYDPDYRSYHGAGVVRVRP